MDIVFSHKNRKIIASQYTFHEFLELCEEERVMGVMDHIHFFMRAKFLTEVSWVITDREIWELFQNTRFVRAKSHENDRILETLLFGKNLRPISKHLLDILRKSPESQDILPNLVGGNGQGLAQWLLMLDSHTPSFLDIPGVLKRMVDARTDDTKRRDLHSGRFYLEIFKENFERLQRRLKETEDPIFARRCGDVKLPCYLRLPKELYVGE